MTRAARLVLAVPLLAIAGGCEGIQTAFGADGTDGARFSGLFQLFLAVTAFVYLLVIGFLLWAIVRRRREEDAHVADNRTHHRHSAFLDPLLIGWTALVVFGLTALGIASYFTDRAAAKDAAAPVLAVKITGNQWWWDVEYEATDPSQSVRTANELHLPVDVPVHIELRSNDVIHSFWVPNLAGKKDLIPGREGDITIIPRTIGLFRGQCAEFCGVQHAHMALDVTVESAADFRRWYAAQLLPAAAPRNAQAAAGLNYVTTRECRMCHAITGTTASGRVGPDLTHLASRRSIAAGTLPMNRGNLYAWVADPQSQKPGNHMPTVGLEPADLHAVVAYLEGLK